MNIRVWFTGQQTTKARLYSKTPRSRGPDGEKVWIPLSVIEHATKYPPHPPEWAEHHLKINDWFGEKAGL